MTTSNNLIKYLLAVFAVILGIELIRRTFLKNNPFMNSFLKGFRFGLSLDAFAYAHILVATVGAGALATGAFGSLTVLLLLACFLLPGILYLMDMLSV